MALRQVEMPVGSFESPSATVVLGQIRFACIANARGAWSNVATSVQASLTDAQSALRLLAREGEGIRIKSAITHAAFRAKVRNHRWGNVQRS